MQQKITLRDVGYPLQEVEGVDKHASRQLAAVEESQYYATYLLFDRGHILTLNYDTYRKCEKREALNKYIQEGIDLPAAFCDLLKSVSSALNVQSPKVTAPQYICLDEKGELTDAPEKGISPVASSFCTSLVIFPENWWPNITGSATGKRLPTFHVVDARKQSSSQLHSVNQVDFCNDATCRSEQ